MPPSHCLLAYLILLLSLAAAGPLAQAATFTEEQERWLEEDSEALTRDVNEGELEFLATPPDRAIHTLHSEFTLTPQSLEDGWLAFRQCHRRLDKVPRSEVTYQYRQMRGLRLESHRHIERIWIEGESVQMEGVGDGAGFCVRAEVRLLERRPDGRFELRNGPFFRAFLDGYYPFHVILEVHQPQPLLTLQTLSPPPQPGLKLSERDGEVRVESWFNGRLTLRLLFSPLPAP